MTMSTDSTYSYKDEKVVIENGIMKGVDSPMDLKHNSYGEFILELLTADPKFVGQVDGLTGKEETFAEMAEKSVKCAIWMREQNVKPGDIVGICSHNHMDLYVPCFASLYIGAIYNAWWDNGLTKEVAKYFLVLTSPKILFVTEAIVSVVLEAIKEVGAEVKVVVFGRKQDFQSLDAILESQNPKSVADFRCVKLSSPEDLAVMLYTSGSTGMPKGVGYSNNMLYHNIYYYSKIDGNKDNVTLIFSPLCWLSGIMSMLRGVVAPDRRIICPEFTEEKFFELVEKYKVTWTMLGTNTSFKLQTSPALSKYDVSSIKFILVGGAPLKGEMQASLEKDFPRSFICQGYGACAYIEGSTELGSVGVKQAPNYKPDSCGRISENIWIKIVDPKTGRTLNPNETGEGCFKSRYMMKGYYNNPEATREAIDSQGWLHTGDLLYYDEEGNIFFVDRMKELIKYRGNQMSPTMIEQLLQTHPAIREVVVVSIPHPTDEEHPIAFVSKTPLAQITEEEVEKIVADTLPDYMKLRGGVKFMDELPHTPSSKVARGELKKLAKSYAV